MWWRLDSSLFLLRQVLPVLLEDMDRTLVSARKMSTYLSLYFVAIFGTFSRTVKYLLRIVIWELR